MYFGLDLAVLDDEQEQQEQQEHQEEEADGNEYDPLDMMLSASTASALSIQQAGGDQHPHPLQHQHQHHFNRTLSATATIGGVALATGIGGGGGRGGGGGGGGGSSTTNEWYLCETVDNVNPITVLCMDHFEELIWTGSSNGRVSAFLNTPEGFRKYSSFPCFSPSTSGVTMESSIIPPRHDVRQLMTENHDIFSLSTNMIRVHSRGGLVRHTYGGGELRDLMAFAFQDAGHSRLVAGGSQKKLFTVDAHTGRLVNTVETVQGTCVVKSGRFVCCGGMMGELSLRDPRTLRVEKSFDVHSGTVTDIDVKGDLLCTCGFSERFGQLFVDPVVRVFDIRTFRPFAQLHFPAGPYLLKFHPMFSSLLVVASQSGYFQIRDVQADIHGLQGFQLDTQNEVLQSFDISGTAEVMAFGDSGGFMHVWSMSNDFSINNFSRETELPVIPEPSEIGDNEDISLSAFEVPYFEDMPLSDWPPTLSFKTGSFPLRIHPKILKSVRSPHAKLVGAGGSEDDLLESKFIMSHDYDLGGGIAPNPGIKRPEDGCLEHRVIPGMDVNGMPPIIAKTPFLKQSKEKHSKLNILPKGYKFTLFQESRLGEFDFARYNKSGGRFSGLENRLENSYCNSYLQVLYSLSPLRHSLMNHLCQRPLCLACELGFLFHMMDQCKGAAADQNNFLRSFRQIKEAAALGLFEGISKSSGDLTLPRRIQNFNRFILEQLHKETTDDNIFQSPYFGEDFVAIGSDNAHSPKTVPAQAPASAQTAPPAPAPSKKSWADIASTNVHPSSRIRQVNATNMNNFGSMTDLFFGSDSRVVVRCTHCQNENIRDTHSFMFDVISPSQPDAPRASSLISLLQRTFCREMRAQRPAGATSASPTGLPRAWCQTCQSYQPMEQKRLLRSLPTVMSLNFPLNEEDVRWLRNQHIVKDPSKPKQPITPRFAVMYDEDVQWRVQKLNDGEEPPKTSGAVVVYELVAVISHVQEPLKENDGHLFAHIKDAHYSKEGCTGSWFLFNDFSVRPSTLDDVIDFSPTWRTPCILFYNRTDIRSVTPSEVRRVNPITDRVFFEDQSLSRIKPARQTFVPLAPHELPKRGDIVAIDAEFVSLRPEEGEIDEDGTYQVLKSGVLSPGRMTVVRGCSDTWPPKLRRMPFIDDYICTNDPVADYLTQFSGLKPGDLDPSISVHHITTLKSSYLKLRWLMDRGVVFVGHGLKKDFKILNIFVPKEQIIDTADLFSFERQRKISLRFLAHYLLHIDIQTESHDSIEDARTALDLYVKYLELKQEGSLESTLTQLYQTGRATNWTIPASINHPQP